LGGSPRSSQYLLAAAKARAALNGLDFVTPDDVKEVAPSVLNHRLLLKPEAEVEGTTTDDVIRQTLGRVAVPRRAVPFQRAGQREFGRRRCPRGGLRLRTRASLVLRRGLISVW